MENRGVHREIGVNMLYPVSCVLRGNGQEYIAEVVNYHFKGACLRTENIPEHDRQKVKLGQFKLDFYLGQNCLQSDISYRVSWQDETDGILFGVEFLNKIPNTLERAERFVTNPKIPIQISAQDPLDPHRMVFFQTVDVSESGMLLKTSLTNKHLLPGMKLCGTKLQIPSQEVILLELGIENTRPGSDSSQFFLGVSVRDKRKEYAEAIRNYLPMALPHLSDADQYLEKLAGSPFKSKKMKGGVTYRVIQSEKQYEDVLKLRFSGYGKHDKVKAGTTWREQGEGLAHEGIILGGYLGASLVCSMELRFGDGKLPLRTCKLMGTNDLTGVDFNRVVELNKLVVHPSIQGSDLVMGMIQRAHTIVVNRGHIDVVLVATDKLKKFYHGFGAIELGMRCPHPSIKDEFLNLMMVRRETYHDGMRFNPYAWSVVYKTIHDHHVALGMAKAKKLTLADQVATHVTKLMLKYKHSKPSNKTSSRVTAGSAFIDPKWTRQEILASVMLPYVFVAKEMIGAERVRLILDEIGVAESYMDKASNWLSISFHDAFLDAFSLYGDSLELSKRAAQRTMKRDMLGVNYYILKHFATPELAFAAFSKIMGKFNRTRTYEVTEMGPGRVRLSLGLVAKSLLPKRSESCANWQSTFEAYIKLMTGRPGRVKKLTCCYNGESSCSYEVMWDRGYLKITPFLPLIGSSITAGVIFNLMMSNFSLVPSLALTVGSFAVVMLCAVGLKIRWLKRDYDHSYQEFLKYQQHAGEKYAELQNAKSLADDMYREARLVEQTMRDIQKKDDIGSLLTTALDAVCLNFKFDRGFAMIVDEKRHFLRTAAVSGINGQSDLLWKFAVDVSAKKENPMLLSSVYHSGSSVLIDDIEQHMFQINEASQEIVRQFGSAGFVLVAIPAKLGNWGVIIADKKSKERRLTRRDIVVLERLSQQIGVALDKRADLERERNLRTHFQRYAPSGLLLASENSEQQAILGAQLRKVGIFFVDIRGFTKLSESLPPAKTVELINGLFSILDPIVRKYGGVVDKYLGDGALVTWGSLGTAEPKSSDLVQCSLEFLEALSNHNQKIMQQGLAPIRVGIGLHIGEALVGTIGSSERLEYTAIGPAVNLASRLEQLSKVYQGDIVASDEVMMDLRTDSNQSISQSGWQKVEGVEVRGIDRKMTVWVYAHVQLNGVTNNFNSKDHKENAA